METKEEMMSKKIDKIIIFSIVFIGCLIASGVVLTGNLPATKSTQALEDGQTTNSATESKPSTPTSFWKWVDTRYYVATSLTEEVRREPSHFNGKVWIYADFTYYIVGYYAEGISEPIYKEFENRKDAERECENGAFVKERIYENTKHGTFKTEQSWS